MRLVQRCLSLCAIKHAIGDFFAINLTWPNPVTETPVFKELIGTPGVYQITTDQATEDSETGQQPFRHLMVTNVSWFW